jgi:5-methylcytosine-specific restriction endonuclease McrA
MQLTKECQSCGVLFEKPYTCSLANWYGNEKRLGGMKFCSTRCSADSRIGKPAHNRGKKGKAWTESRRAATTEAARERRRKWVSNSVKRISGGRWSYVRSDVLARDNHTCQKCGFSDKEIMTVDHIKPKAIAPELMYAMDNCVTLCPNCHARKTIQDKKLIHQVTTIANA